MTVLGPFDYMEISLPMTKVLACGPDEYAKAHYPLMLEEGVVYSKGTMTSFNDGVAETSTGEKIPFDVCVLATGQKISWFLPDPVNDATLEERKRTVADLYNEVTKANIIVISGAGPVGTEVAADIKIRNKNKK